MSRSIHRTGRDFEIERRTNHGDPELRRERLAAIERDLDKKAWIKERVRRSRRSPRAVDPPREDIEQLPIRVVDGPPLVQHFVDADLLRGFMRRLPPGSWAGLTEIRLVLGRERMVEFETSQGDEPWSAEQDPVTGRLGYEVLPGVHAGSVLGTYFIHSASIELYGYVLARDVDPALSAFFSLSVLSTLVHELGHHYDHMLRKHGDRWLGDDENKSELYADRVQHGWTSEFVMPYLRSVDPDSVARLEEWILQHGKCRVPAEALVGADPDAPLERFFSIHGAFCSLVEDIAEERDPIELRIRFAEELHFAERYDLALEALESVLVEHPQTAAAIGLQADIYQHLDRTAEAEELARRALAIDGGCEHAWVVLLSERERARDWTELARLAEEALRVADEGSWRLESYVQYRLSGLLGLGRYGEVLDETDRIGRPSTRRVEVGYQALALLRMGRPGEALGILDAEPIPEGMWRMRALIPAARFHALHLLGRADEAEALEAEALEDRVLGCLRYSGLEEWAGELEALAAR